MNTAGENIKRTMALLKEEKPVLRDLLDAFEPLLLARAQCVEDLAGDVTAFVDSLPQLAGAGSDEVTPESLQGFAQGVSLLTDSNLALLWPQIQKAAGMLLPVFADHPSILPCREESMALFADPAPEGQDEAFRKAFLEHIIHQNEVVLLELVKVNEEQVASLAFAGEFVLSAVLRAVTAALRTRLGKNWNLWTQGYCPVCGRLPVLDTLAKGVTDEQNPYLLAGGGRKHLHCGLCSADWIFRRAVCPACGSEEKGTMNVLYATTKQSEHIAWCSSCNTYCVGLDLRAMSDSLDMDAMALGLLPLDMVAAEKNLTPMCRTFWNQF